MFVNSGIGILNYPIALIQESKKILFSSSKTISFIMKLTEEVLRRGGQHKEL